MTKTSRAFQEKHPNCNPDQSRDYVTQVTTLKLDQKNSNNVANIATRKAKQQTKHQEHHTNANTKIDTTTKTTGLLHKQQHQHQKKGRNKSKKECHGEKTTPKPKHQPELFECHMNNNTNMLLRLFPPFNFGVGVSCHSFSILVLLHQCLTHFFILV